MYRIRKMPPTVWPCEYYVILSLYMADYCRHRLVVTMCVFSQRNVCSMPASCCAWNFASRRTLSAKCNNESAAVTQGVIVKLSVCRGVQCLCVWLGCSTSFWRGQQQPVDGCYGGQSALAARTSAGQWLRRSIKRRSVHLHRLRLTVIRVLCWYGTSLAPTKLNAT